MFSRYHKNIEWEGGCPSSDITGASITPPPPEACCENIAKMSVGAKKIAFIVFLALLTYLTTGWKVGRVSLKPIS